MFWFIFFHLLFVAVYIGKIIDCFNSARSERETEEYWRKSDERYKNYLERNEKTKKLAEELNAITRN